MITWSEGLAHSGLLWKKRSVQSGSGRASTLLATYSIVGNVAAWSLSQFMYTGRKTAHSSCGWDLAQQRHEDACWHAAVTTSIRFMAAVHHSSTLGAVLGQLGLFSNTFFQVSQINASQSQRKRWGNVVEDVHVTCNLQANGRSAFASCELFFLLSFVKPIHECSGNRMLWRSLWFYDISRNHVRIVLRINYSWIWSSVPMSTCGTMFQGEPIPKFIFICINDNQIFMS